jgi:hypothetical protein
MESLRHAIVRDISPSFVGKQVPQWVQRKRLRINRKTTVKPKKKNKTAQRYNCK